MALITFEDLPSTNTPLNAANLNNNFTECNNIVESGSNANGNYIKFNDGTMICYFNKLVTDQAIDGSYGSLYVGHRRWTFPQQFYSVPITSIGRLCWGTGAPWGVTYNNEINYTDLRFYDVVSRSAGSDFHIQAIAIGRWK